MRTGFRGLPALPIELRARTHRGKTLTEPSPTKPGKQAYAQRTSRGLFWMLISSVINKGGAFVAQIVLGWLLLDEDFGLYAIAISVSSLVQIFRDGGTRKIVVQRGERHFARLCPSVFWMATGFNVAAAALLAAGAYPISLLYQEPELTGMILVLALSCLVGTPDTMYRAWLSVQMRFRELARVQLASGLIRSASMIVLAVLGAGAQSFVWPAVFAALGSWIMGRLLCGPLPLAGRLRPILWRILLGSSIWLIVGSGAMMMTRQGSYMILGLFHDPAIIGVYFFAYQLLMQLNQLLAANIQAVLLPTLSAVQREQKRFTGAVIRSSQSMMIISSAFAMSVSVGSGDLIRFVWGSKWEGSIPAVLWMGAFFPTRMLLNVFEPTMQARGRYRTWAYVSIAQAVILLVATLIVSIVGDSPGDFAIGIGIGLLVSLLAGWFAGLPRIGVPVWPVLGGCMPAYLIGIAVYALVVFARFELGFETIQPRPRLVAQGICSALIFLGAYTLIIRVLMPGALSNTCDALPGKLARRCRRVLMLKK